MIYKNKLVLGLIIISCSLILCIAFAIIFSLINQQQKVQTLDISVVIGYAVPEGMIVSPPKKYIDAISGKTIEERIKIMFNGKTPAVGIRQLNVRIIDLAIDQSTCKPIEQKGGKFSASNWAYFDISKIKDNAEVVEIPLIIEVPTNMKSGSYLFGISTEDENAMKLIQPFIVVLGSDRSERCLSYEF